LEIAIDARSFRTGLGTYTFHLLAGLAEKNRDLDVRAIVSHRTADLFAPFCKSLRFVNAPIYTLREQIEIPIAARGCDVLHVPHYNLPVMHRGPLLTTIHDLTHLLDDNYSNSARSWLYARPMFGFVARRAEHIFTVSEYSKSRIVERLGVDPARITVVYCGVSPQFHPLACDAPQVEISDSLRISRPYLLFVGNLKPHKNLATLLQAFRSLVSLGFEHHLVCVGDDRRGRPTIEELIRQLNLNQRVSILAQVESEILVNLYAGAELLILPSFQEGFGLPVVEAMACGTPVVCSRSASLPEVGGDAAEYFDPHNYEELTTVLQRVLGSARLRKEMSRKGLLQSAKFTWQNFVDQHYQVYKIFSC
jgi:glycosyltransferase involved in cell wall biosynthesis